MWFKSLVCVALLGTAQMAAAADYLITYTGTVRNSDDVTGEFGGSGSSLDGLAFSLVYRFTFPAPLAQVVESPTRYTLLGGAVNGSPAFLQARLTINGVTQIFSGATQSGLDRYDEQAGFYDAVFEEASDYDLFSPVQYTRFVQAGIGSDDNQILASTDVTASRDYIFQAGDTPFGGFYIRRYDAVNDIVLNSASGQFNYERLTQAAAVPEPATWTLLIGGFGVVGIAARRTRRLASIA